MYKKSLEKAEEAEIKLSTFVGSWIKEQNYRKTSTSASLTSLNLCVGMHAKSLVMLDSFATPWTVVCQAPLSMGFSRQEY